MDDLNVESTQEDWDELDFVLSEESSWEQEFALLNFYPEDFWV